jgi:hypothetical protein
MSFNNSIIFYIIIFILLMMCFQYKKKLSQQDIYDERDLINRFLLRDDADFDDMFRNNKKPIIWIHIDYKTNSRKWLDYGSRNSKNLNRSYISLTLRSIIERCGSSFHICIIDDKSFYSLIPYWEIDVFGMANPLQTHIRELALAKILERYGGMRFPASFICFTDLLPLYKSAAAQTMFVAEMQSATTRANAFGGDDVVGDLYLPNTTICGCAQNSLEMQNYISYLETLITQDYTNEMDVSGKINMWLAMNHNIHVISANMFGIRTASNKAVLIDDLMGDFDIDFDPNAVGIYIPDSDLLRRIHFGWFLRMTPEQILSSNTIVGKYLLIYNGSDHGIENDKCCECSEK